MTHNQVGNKLSLNMFTCLLLQLWNRFTQLLGWTLDESVGMHLVWNMLSQKTCIFKLCHGGIRYLWSISSRVPRLLSIFSDCSPTLFFLKPAWPLRHSFPCSPLKKWLISLFPLGHWAGSGISVLFMLHVYFQTLSLPSLWKPPSLNFTSLDCAYYLCSF